MLAPLTGVPAVKQDIDMVASNKQRFSTFNSEKMKFHRMNASCSNSLYAVEDPQIPPSQQFTSQSSLRSWYSITCCRTFELSTQVTKSSSALKMWATLSIIKMVTNIGAEGKNIKAYCFVQVLWNIRTGMRVVHLGTRKAGSRTVSGPTLTWPCSTN